MSKKIIKKWPLGIICIIVIILTIFGLNKCVDNKEAVIVIGAAQKFIASHNLTNVVELDNVVYVHHSGRLWNFIIKLKVIDSEALYNSQINNIGQLFAQNPSYSNIPNDALEYIVNNKNYTFFVGQSMRKNSFPEPYNLLIGSRISFVQPASTLNRAVLVFDLNDACLIGKEWEIK